MADFHQLFGSCACERNQYEVIIPSQSASLAQVFFDNTALSRRTQASPVTAWLRCPLDWYSSATIAQFPDESHSSIKRTFITPAQSHSSPPTRRQFCGYCGSHLTRWNESLHAYTTTNDAGYIDVTLGSLLHESLEKLENLRILSDNESEEEAPSNPDGLVKGGVVDDEDHIPTNEKSVGGVDGPPRQVSQIVQAPHDLHHRGMPYFEDMVEHSRLGKIKRRRGGHTSEDGSTRVQWEVIEIGPESDSPMTDMSSAPTTNKRIKLDR